MEYGFCFGPRRMERLLRAALDGDRKQGLLLHPYGHDVLETRIVWSIV